VSISTTPLADGPPGGFGRGQVMPWRTGGNTKARRNGWSVVDPADVTSAGPVVVQGPFELRST